MKYLTESKLGSILKDIYPNKDIVPQFKYNGKKWDYKLVFENEEYTLLPTGIRNIIDNCIYEDEERYDGVYVLLIEFDGHYHYSKNSQAAFESSGLFWERVDYSTFLLRIPYWIQPDSVMMNQWFDVPKDYSEDFPHGFISKNVFLPEIYCKAGEERFKEEMKKLPLDISQQVLKSLIDKTGFPYSYSVKKMAKTGNMELWRFLIDNFHPEWASILKTMEELSPDIGKFYKYFSPELYTILETNPIIKGLYMWGSYVESLDKDELDESIGQYCRYHGIVQEDSNTIWEKKCTVKTIRWKFARKEPNS
jgi:hypothetical protein